MAPLINLSEVAQVRKLVREIEALVKETETSSDMFTEDVVNNLFR